MRKNELLIYLILSWVFAGAGVVLWLYGFFMAASLCAGISVYSRNCVGSFSPSPLTVISAYRISSIAVAIYMVALAAIALLNMDHIEADGKLATVLMAAMFAPFLCVHIYHECYVYRLLKKEPSK